ncbi:MAG: hypothetical protein HXN79_11150 [Prevotella pallens]|uniref:hypothetical protein n=2 Tax=Prevotella pallens TaxID=60133 RepID=UPI001CB2E3C8|nr:hypothetical protein [Prevotella pallens]MBF1488842.1 hypothetical protein [Prevotella pallens]
MKRIHVFNNVEMRFGLWKYTFLVMQKYGHDESVPYAGGVFATNFVGVRHVIGSLSAAVGADLSRPHIRKHTRNGKRKYRFDDVKHTCAMTNICVFDNVNTRIW